MYGIASSLFYLALSSLNASILLAHPLRPILSTPRNTKHMSAHIANIQLYTRQAWRNKNTLVGTSSDHRLHFKHRNINTIKSTTMKGEEEENPQFTIADPDNWYPWNNNKINMTSKT